MTHENARLWYGGVSVLESYPEVYPMTYHYFHHTSYARDVEPKPCVAIHYGFRSYIVVHINEKVTVIHFDVPLWFNIYMILVLGFGFAAFFASPLCGVVILIVDVLLFGVFHSQLITNALSHVNDADQETQ